MSLQGVQIAPCMAAEPTLSLQNLDLDQPTSLSDILGLSPRNSPIDENHPGFKEVKTLQCGEFKYPDVSSPLYKILGEARRNGRGPLYELSPRKKILPTDASGDFGSSASGPVRGSSSLSISPYNPNFDEVFLMSTRTPEASPYRHHQNHFRYVDPATGQSHSPESDVGYGTSFGSQDFNGHNIDIDSISNLLRSLSLNSGATIGPENKYYHQQPAQMNSTSSSGNSKDDSLDHSDIFDPTIRHYKEQATSATIGPCLAKLDPAVAQAVQSKFQPFDPLNEDGGGVSNFSNFLSPIRRRHQGRSSNGMVASPKGMVQFDSMSLEKVAKMHRNSAAYYDANCTWRGQLPIRSHNQKTLSMKVFLGGVPWDITENNLIQAFRPFGNIRIEWPGKDSSSIPKGYLYVIFEHDKQVRSLLSACTRDFGTGGGSWYFKVSSKRMRNKEVQVIPWVIGDSSFVRCSTSGMDASKTVFVGALHGMLSAECLANIFQDLFKGVVYAGIDTDKYKYPIGSGRVVFNNTHSYMKAVSAAFIEIKTGKFTKKIQVDPYLEDALCSNCSLRQGPYFCREMSCFKYYCRSCWDSEHVMETMRHHKPIMRNSRNNSSSRSSNNNNNGTNHQHATSHQKSSVPLPQMSPVENYY